VNGETIEESILYGKEKVQKIEVLFKEKKRLKVDVDYIKLLDEGLIRNETKSQKYDAKFLILALSVLSKAYEASKKELKSNYSSELSDAFIRNVSHLNTYPDDFLTQLGILKVSF